MSSTGCFRQFRSPFQRILGGCIEVTLISSVLAAALLLQPPSPSPAYPAHPAHGWFLILMLSWGGSLLSQCPACSLKEAGNIHVPAGSPESQLWSRQAHRNYAMSLFQHTSVPQHTPTSEQSPQLPGPRCRAASYLRTSHQGMRSVLWYSGFWGCGFPTLSMDSQVLNTLAMSQVSPDGHAAGTSHSLSSLRHTHISDFKEKSHCNCEFCLTLWCLSEWDHDHGQSHTWRICVHAEEMG